MKHFRRLLPAICLLLISAMCAGTSTYAWFTLNEQVTATGMKVKATASGSLVIDTTTLSATSKKTTVDFAMASGTELKPCTYDSTSYKDINAGTKAKVDPITGKAESYGYDTVAATDASYIKTFTVYVGAQGQDVAGVIPTFTFSGVTSDQDKAVTMRIFKDGSFVGTTNGVTKTWTGTSFTAPNVASSTGVCFKIEVYFDGALENGGVCYIHSQNMSLNNVSISMDFSVPQS